MTRRLISAIALVVTLTLAIAAPVAACWDSDYDIDGVEQISDGEDRDFFIVYTFETSLTMDQADEVCQDIGLDEAVGIERVRYKGQKIINVTCAGEEMVK